MPGFEQLDGRRLDMDGDWRFGCRIDDVIVHVQLVHALELHAPCLIRLEGHAEVVIQDPTFQVVLQGLSLVLTDHDNREDTVRWVCVGR